MKQNFVRRHSRWYELLLFNAWVRMLGGCVLVVFVPCWLNWGTALNLRHLHPVQINTIITSATGFVASFIILQKLKTFPGTRALPFIMPTVLATWLTVFSVLLFLREETYSRPVLLGSFSLTLAWEFVGYFLAKRYKQPKLALVPFGRALELADVPQAETTILEKPDLGDRRYDGIVADLHGEILPQEWERFLAHCTLARIPVYHTQRVIESLTGRVKVDRLSENIFGSLQPSIIYSTIKRFIDCILAIILLPIFIPIFFITAISIKIDSKGSIFFLQKRIGYRGKEFIMYKFRSMKTNSYGKNFTICTEDPRITRVGSFIRKYRIDELPQILNILKGEMSFIGPRPESLELSTWYEKEIPFFSYRHVVRPGISGWAQVSQGYAAEIKGVGQKLQYDFYYIKHFSLWLDLLIVAKTIRTICTGFGAR